MKRFSVLLALTLLCANPLATFATENEAQTQLAQMETKFFGRTYESETPEARADRLENLILGNVLKGDTNQRIKNLSIATASAEAETNQLYVPDNEQNAPQAADKQSQRTSANTGGVSKQDYPHVDFLEDAILGQTYSGEALPDRLARMETKAFGAVSSNDDLSSRTDALEQYVEQKLHKKKYPVATADNQSADDDTSKGGSKTSSGPSRAGMASKQLLMLAANTLLGLSGVPMGFGTYPPGYFGTPSSRSSNGRSAQSGQRFDSSGDEVKDDPAVSLPDPPPPTARLLTKVGWCEMQVFGKTYNDLHLEERLKQLSAKLNLDARKSGIELMDHVDDMIKAVKSRKPA